MKNPKIGFIGGGNMGGAMIANLAQRLGGESVFVYARSKTAALREKCGVNACESEAAVASAADITVLATKPAAYLDILNLIKDAAQGKVIVTLAPNFSLEQASQILGTQAKIARAMPNTPAAIAEGVSALCFNENLSADELNLERIFLGARSIVGIDQNSLNSEQEQRARLLKNSGKLKFKNGRYYAKNFLTADEISLFIAG